MVLHCRQFGPTYQEANMKGTSNLLLDQKENVSRTEWSRVLESSKELEIFQDSACFSFLRITSHSKKGDETNQAPGRQPQLFTAVLSISLISLFSANNEVKWLRAEKDWTKKKKDLKCKLFSALCKTHINGKINQAWTFTGNWKITSMEEQKYIRQSFGQRRRGNPDFYHMQVSIHIIMPWF